MKETQNFTKGNILTSLVRFALPVLAALFLQTMYGAVDMLVVGQFATAADVSAVSTGSWLMQLITSFVVGIAMGTTVLLGRRLGEGKPEEAGKIIGASIVLFTIIGVVITFFMELCAVPVAQIMRTPIEPLTQRSCMSVSVRPDRFLSLPTMCWAVFSGESGIQGCRWLQWQ